ncbi:hypothetical protein CY34DRAFT_88110, partial [Suillus luteus UH-Slu-Lm8-n1]
ILNYWWDQQESYVGSIFKFKAWMDVMVRMYSPITEDADGDADDESPRIRPTRKLLVLITLSLTFISNG